MRLRRTTRRDDNVMLITNNVPFWDRLLPFEGT